MKKAILIPVSVIFCTSLLLACLYHNKDQEIVVMGLTYNILKSLHYEKIVFDDDLSKKINSAYIKYLDYSKRIFLKADIKKFERYNTKLDDQIKQSKLDYFNLTYSTLKNRIEYVKEIYPEILSKPFDLTKQETIGLEPKEYQYATTEKKLYDVWRKTLKFEIIQEIDAQLVSIEQKKEKGEEVEEKTIAELEISARETVKKNYDDYFDRLSKLRREDYFALYINAIASSIDPHTAYFAPKPKENFEIYISGELEGIGATLSQRFGEIKVVDVVVGGAAWKQGELEQGDIIIKVAQEGEKAINISNMRLDDAVRHIRGKKGTNVYLTVKKADGIIKKIKIVRDKIIIEDTFIRTVIFDDTVGNKVAYINMPSFYIDFNNRNGRRCSEDFKNELIKLKDNDVEGIIIDLRNNSGGSLQEVVKIAGYFITSGPIVQVKDREGKTMQLNDRDASLLFDGNVLIMINQFSASASEIFSAALQDYNRAVVFGSKKSLGKGTVQTVFDLDKAVKFSKDIKPLGALKFTIQKYYRINGGSTQLKGVLSDIVDNSSYTNPELFESASPNALPWDRISKLDYKLWIPNYNIDSLRAWSYSRMQTDSSFIASKKYSKFFKKEYEKKYLSLNLNTFRTNNKIKRKERDDFNKYYDKKIPIKINYLKDDITLMQKDTLIKYRYDIWMKKLEKDHRIQEAFNIVVDMNNKF